MNSDPHETTAAAAPTELPLVVGLDGALTRTDTLYEGLVELVRTRPLDALRIPAWLRAGKARLRREVGERAPIDVSLLPYDGSVLARLRAARSAGRRTVLAADADVRVAHAVADHLGLFDEVISTADDNRPSGNDKRDILAGRFGSGGFEYIGSSQADEPVWAAAQSAILSNVRPTLAEEIRSRHDSVEVLSGRPAPLGVLVRAARPYQWVKNALVFVPILASQQVTASNLWLTGLAFLCFSLAASSVYLVNDIMDLDADRRHPRKSTRPFAAGRASLLQGPVVAGLLMGAALAAAFIVAPAFGLVLAGYLLVTSNYSLWIKRYALVDVVVLAGLYTLRLVAGGAVTETPLSLWLLAFSMFLFTSLAFAKRYAEIAEILQTEGRQAAGRGYKAGDQAVLMSLGTAAGLASIITLALFVNSPTNPELYNNPELLWGVCPILLFWVAHIWLAAQRGTLTDDPIVFAFSDRGSQAAFVLALVPVALAIWL